jgi:hypothetical protein
VPIKTCENTYEALFKEDKSWIVLHQKYLNRMSKVTHLDVSSHRKHSQWVALTRHHATLLVRFNYLSDFARCVVPDEHYVGSVLTQLGEEKNILRQEQTMAYWNWVSKVQMSPMEHTHVSDEHVAAMRDTTAIFARKFSANSNINERWGEIV